MSCRRRVLIRMETRGTTAQERRTPTSAHGPSAVRPSRWGRPNGRYRGTGRIMISTITPDTRIPADRKAAPTERIIRDRIRASVVVIKARFFGGGLLFITKLKSHPRDQFVIPI